MPSLKQAARAGERAGAPLPGAYRTLTDKQVQFRRGHLHVVASAPGAGKSVFAINLAVKAAVPTLYLAMDGDESSMSIRVMQAWHLWTREQALAELGNETAKARKAFDTIDEYVRWDFPNNPDMEEIRDRVWAFAEIFGEFPHLIVVDNLMDVVYEQSSAAYTDAESALTSLARAANSAVVVLAHVNGLHEGSREHIPLSGVMFKATKKASLILTMNPGMFSEVVWVSVLKNRDGPADPSGLGVRAQLTVDYERMQAS